MSRQLMLSVKNLGARTGFEGPRIGDPSFCHRAVRPVISHVESTHGDKDPMIDVDPLARAKRHLP
jgi:hypothetical protein